MAHGYSLFFAALFLVNVSFSAYANPSLDGAVTPDWFTETRIHAHTRLSPLAWKRTVGNSALEKFLFDRNAIWAEGYDHAEEALAKMGVSVYTRHGKTMDEEPPWPSSMPRNEHGPLQDPNTKDLITPITERARAEGVHVLIYYWDNSDTLSRTSNTSWTCKDKNGKIIGHSVKGPHLDISSEYKKTVAARLIELRNKGASGIYLDWRHFPPTGCFGTELEQRFREQHPEFSEVRSSSPSFWRAFQLFQADTMADVINEWADFFRQDTNFAMVVSVTSLPNLINREMTYDLARAGIPKTEFHIATKKGLMNYLFQYNPDLKLRAPSPEARMAFGWSMLRTVSKSSPHVWINGVPTWEQLMLAVGAVVSHGGIANVDIDERNITEASDEDGVKPRAVLKKIYGLNTRIGPLFKNAAPSDYVAVHFSETERNKYGKRNGWVKVASPALKVFETLLAAGVPVVGIDDRILLEGDLSAYSYVVSPVPHEETLPNIEKYGVEYLHIPPPGPMTFNRARYYSESVATILETFRNDPNTIKVTLKDKNDHFVVWEDSTQDRIIVSIVKPFSDVQVGSKSQPAKTPYFSLSDNEKLASELRIESKRLDGKAYCVFDGLTGEILSAAEKRILIPGPSPWRVIEIKPCR